jgi:hypothetical protein
MSRARKIDVSVETVSTSRLVGYGVESTRLNFDTNTNAPLYKPYKDFQCYAANSNDLTSKDHQVEEYDHAGQDDVDDVPYNNPYYEYLVPRADSDASSGIQNASLPAFESLMEQMKSRDHHTIKILRHNVEHCSIFSRFWRTANVLTTCCSQFLNGPTMPM